MQRVFAPFWHEVLGRDIAWEISMIEDRWPILAEPGTLVPEFEHCHYTQPSANWDHDHCVGCFAKFMEQPHADALQLGWATVSPQPLHPDPEDHFAKLKDGSVMVGAPSNAREWLCDDCHLILKELLTGKIMPKAV